jgi:nicotinamidase/pyrazinamidase
MADTATRTKRAHLAVDVQDCFYTDGAVPVAGGERVVEAILRDLDAGGYDLVVASQDDHPRDHCSFVAQGGAWQPHGFPGRGEEGIHPELRRRADLVVSKGTDPGREAYSAFDGTGLAETLRERGVRELTISGLATDYCVRASVLDALREGFDVHVLADGVCAVNVRPGDGARAVADMVEAGAHVD